MNKARFPAILFIAAVVIAVDRCSKIWFLDHFQFGETRRVISGLYVTLVHNTAAAFGLFQNNNRALLILSYGILLLLLYGARGLWERGGTWAFWGVAFILGGAVGNMVDRHLYGHVIDFIDLRVWPVFNLADSAISVGAFCTALGLLRHSKKSSG